MPIEDFELKPEHLRDTCDPDCLGFETTADLPELHGSVGQDRATAAITFGLDMESKGYNIFAAGPRGTGRNFAVASQAKAAADKQPTPDDWCYVYNFHDSGRPVALRLPPGMGPQFAIDVDDLIATCRQEIPRAFESESYEARKEKATGDVQAERNRVLQELDEQARSEGFMIQPTPMGLVTVPLADGKPMSREQFEQLSEERRNEINGRTEQLRGRMQEALSQARQLEKEARSRLEELDREVAMGAVGDRFGEVKEKYNNYPAVIAYLDNASEDVVVHQAEFRGAEQAASDGRAAEAVPARYRVNVLVTQEDGDGAPVVEENSPTYYNLLGRLEYRPVA
ncbi:MAG: AAA family ATPase, partial [Armatimonadota bacterium]|nr:AAA family ATPase [Armatimonadota bacterium]